MTVASSKSHGATWYVLRCTQNGLGSDGRSVASDRDSRDVSNFWGNAFADPLLGRRQRLTSEWHSYVDEDD